MYELTLHQLGECVQRGDRRAALRVVRAAVDAGQVEPRDAVELMLAIRQGWSEGVWEAVGAMRAGLPGTYRFVPKADHDFA